jgi:flagellar hook-associated protein 1
MVATDASKIAAARPDAAGLVHAGDGANALGMAQLRTGLTLAGGSQTFSGFYGTLVARVGSAKQSADNDAERQDAALGVVQGLQQQTSGVSTDEELINLTQAQNAYAAAAHYITAINEVFATLLDMTR